MSNPIVNTGAEPVAGDASRWGRIVLAGAMAILLGLSACASSDDGETTATPETIAYSTPETTAAVAVVEESEGETIEAMAVDTDLDAPLDRLDNEGVIDAAVIILSEGNLEEALASGRVSDLEVDTALLAIASGTLGEYAG